MASFSHNHSWESPHSGLVLFFHRSAKSPSSLPLMVLLLGSPPPSNPVSHLGGSGCLGKGNLGHHSTSSPESAPPLWAGGAVAIPWCRSVKVSVVDQLGCPPPFTPWHATTINKLNKRNNSHGGAFNTYKWAPLGSTFNIHKGLPLRYNLERVFLFAVRKKILAPLGTNFGTFAAPPSHSRTGRPVALGGQTGGPVALYGGMGRPVANPPPPGTSWQASGLPGGNGEASGQPSPPPPVERPVALEGVLGRPVANPPHPPTSWKASGLPSCGQKFLGHCTSSLTLPPP